MPIMASITDQAPSALTAIFDGWPRASLADDAGRAAFQAAPGDALHRLLAWTSPSFPIGAFSYSHGIEQAVEDGAIATASDLTRWIEGLLRFGAGRTDAGFAVRAARAAAAHDDQGLLSLARTAAALAPAAERALEARQQGGAFLDAVARGWGLDQAADFAARLAVAGIPPTLAVAAGACGGWAGLPEAMLIEALLHGFATNLVSAGVRLVPLGQTDGQRAIAALGPVIAAIAADARRHPQAPPGGCAVLADITALRHETLYSRLFRS